MSCSIPVFVLLHDFVHSGICSLSWGFLKQIDLSPEFEESTRKAGLTAKVGVAKLPAANPCMAFCKLIVLGTCSWACHRD